MRLIPLFNGGIYKRGEDDGRNRIPLTASEAEQVHHDPELPGAVSPSSTGSEFNMAKWAHFVCNLEVGDELLLGLVTDASIVRSLFMMSFDPVNGFTGDLDLVSVPAIAAAYAISGPAAVGVPRTGTATNVVAYDFTDGLGEATKDAIDKAALWGGVPADYRNNAALGITNFATPIPLALGNPQYLRFTVTALGEIASTASSCCSTCDGGTFPTFQVGAIRDILCADKQRARTFCNCPVNLCGDPCPTTPDVTPPVIGPFVDQNGTVGVPIGVMDLNLPAPSEPIVTWTAAPLPPGLSLDSGTGLITGTPATVGTTTVSVTGLDAAGNVSLAVTFDFIIA